MISLIEVAKTGVYFSHTEKPINIEKIVIERLKEGFTRRMNEFMENIENIERNLETTNGNINDKELLCQYKKRIKKIKQMNSAVNKFIILSKPFV